MFLYTKTTVLSDQMLKLEKDTKQLRIENISLEKQLANNYSLENLTKLAVKYGFSKISNPVYLKQLHYAFILDHD
ncbi:hypothetical protein A3C23_02840 [Candidatus Roizmanbacteria bacterium RIFCSPHIGHO2_02_FULL_37_13b]|uniref:Uncharacterized protein n=1 Tax=Candidatus Roizmanbacteria bacterium RIFCSPLOWO2_02_FULL_36_11 TaxID=1802071 RepID=A0A1F7JG73_9BACT|nr:MAG: hypothetical protein A3C23_02840 [Candidatus Roizmanbacteria bacterium RIFCSPHIGHO2_02_FULL_37_13b]OGK54610.1 MAG: hypothetical protein A3H78_01860 [Candidatus Roizmanbacteria bacterium RIFCSPLOWO2_02_FULL_36_11]